jgi:aryl-alcohol dehydrogenase-like predicted oxidoreductase
LPEVPTGTIDLDDWVATSVAASLQRLRLESLYGLLLHRPDALLRPGGDELYATLQRLKRDGLVQKIGISIYAPAELDAICERYPPDLVQAPFNIVDRRLSNSGWMQRLAAAGIEIHVRSVFLQGLLLMQPQQRPQKFTQWAPIWQQLDSWLQHNGISSLEACLSFASSFVEIDRIIVGVDSLQQLQAIVAALQKTVPPVPDALASNDLKLVDPSRWAALD